MTATTLLPSRWDEARATALDEPGRLLLRSNLLGSDRAITNYAGGNTSAKIRCPDPLTREPVEVLWVKGSGGDLGSMKLDGFATLYMERLLALERRYHGREHGDDMVPLYAPAPSASTARGEHRRAAARFVPHAHVDHMHPDMIIAIAAAKDGEAPDAQIWEARSGGSLAAARVGLGVKLGAACAARGPELRGLVLGGHGLFVGRELAGVLREHARDDRARRFLAPRARAAPLRRPSANRSRRSPPRLRRRLRRSCAASSLARAWSRTSATPPTCSPS
jgi:rhamnose utilization protein RhaD (predicted bifunctional aldolase and dehydrogenase)